MRWALIRSYVKAQSRMSGSSIGTLEKRLSVTVFNSRPVDYQLLLLDQRSLFFDIYIAYIFVDPSYRIKTHSLSHNGSQGNK